MFDGMTDSKALPVLLQSCPSHPSRRSTHTCTLSVVQLEVCDEALVARLQDGCGVRWEKQNLDVVTPVLHARRVSRSAPPPAGTCY